MKTIYSGLAAVSMVFLLLTGFAQAGDGNVKTPMTTEAVGQTDEALPLGLLLDENGNPFIDEIVIKDGLIYT